MKVGTVKLPFLVAMVALLATARATCTSLPTHVWPMYQYRSDRNAVFSSPAWNLSWKTTLGGKVNGALSIVGTTLYAESFDFSVYAFDALTGRQLWKRQLIDIAMNAPIVVNDTVVVGSGVAGFVSEGPDGQVLGEPGGDFIYGLDAKTGAIRWQFKTAGENMPTGVYDLVRGRPAFIFTNGDGHIYALSIADGRLLWKRRKLGATTMSSLASTDGMIYGTSTWHSPTLARRMLARGDFGFLRTYSWTWAIRPEHGNFVWTGQFGIADGSPTVADGTLYTESEYLVNKHLDAYNVVTAADARTGRIRWQWRSSVGSFTKAGSGEGSIAGVYHAGVYYESIPYPKEFAAFDAHSAHHLKWLIHTKSAVKMSAVIRDGLLYVGDVAGYFYVVRASDGTVLRTIKFPTIFGPSPPLIVGTTLFITNGRAIYAIPLDDVLAGRLTP